MDGDLSKIAFAGSVAPPSGARRVARVLAAEGFECFAVGGCVRDSLLGVKPKDWDFATDATTDEMKRAFDAAGLAWSATGERHGTLTALVDGEGYEVTTYRIDGPYSDGRHPDAVTFTRQLDDDLARRDFTINAMAWSPERGLVDPFGGRKDLAAGVIRAVGDPERRFDEDALRVLRGVRFAATLGFAVEPATADAMHDAAQTLTRLARERVFGELELLLRATDGTHLAAALAAFSDVALSALFDGCLPLYVSHLPDFSPLRFTEPDLVLRLGLLYRLAAGVVAAEPPDLNPEACFRVLCAPRKLATEAARLVHLAESPLPTEGDVSWQPASLATGGQCDDERLETRQTGEANVSPLSEVEVGVRRLLAACGSERMFIRVCSWHEALAQTADEPAALANVALVRRLGEAVLAAGMPLSVHDLAVSGDDLKAAGVSPGPSIGRALHKLHAEVVDGRLPNARAALLAAL